MVIFKLQLTLVIAQQTNITFIETLMIISSFLIKYFFKKKFDRIILWKYPRYLLYLFPLKYLYTSINKNIQSLFDYIFKKCHVKFRIWYRWCHKSAWFQSHMVGKNIGTIYWICEGMKIFKLGPPYIISAGKK